MFTVGQKRLMQEMARDQRVILIQRHPRRWMELRYTINSFPMRNLQHQTVTKLVQLGCIRLNNRGYYVLSTKGMLVAARYQQRQDRKAMKKMETTCA